MSEKERKKRGRHGGKEIERESSRDEKKGVKESEIWKRKKKG